LNVGEEESQLGIVVRVDGLACGGWTATMIAMWSKPGG
jgi:hypothetical protein